MKALGEHLTGTLAENLEKISMIYLVSTKISGLIILTETHVEMQINYVKGKESMVLWWVRTTHIGVYLYATVRACGKTKQNGNTK